VSNVPERDIVDRALTSARSVLNGVQVDDPFGLYVRQFCDVVICCTEALVHQIRDADDTQATVLMPELKDAINDFALVVSGKLSDER
jgi:hypothetical protein